MLKHLEDKGDLNMIIDDGGNLLIICPKCKTVWHGKFTLAMSPGIAAAPPGGAAPKGFTIVTPRGAAAPDGFVAINPEVVPMSPRFAALQQVLSGQPGKKMVMTAYMEKSDLLKDAGIDMESIDDLKPS
jgi:hypothetical protein